MAVANKMPLPQELIEARELSKKASALASRGFIQIIKREPVKTRSVAAFAKMVESFSVVEREFGVIEKEATAAEHSTLHQPHEFQHDPQ